MNQSNYPEAKPVSGNKAKKLIVLLHGLGSDGDDLFSLVPFIQPAFPDYHFISPHGVEEYEFGFGRQWFSLQNRDTNFLVSELERNAPKADKIIMDKATEIGLSKRDVILVGFSQGTMLSLYLALTSDNEYNAVVGFSGTLIIPKNIKQNKTPVCLIHGENDEVVSFSMMKFTQEKLIENGCLNVESHHLSNLGHSIDLRGLEIAKNFLKDKK